MFLVSINFDIRNVFFLNWNCLIIKFHLNKFIFEKLERWNEINKSHWNEM